MRRFLAETCLADGALFEEFGRRKVLTMEWPGMIIFSATMEYHWREKSGRGTDQRIFLDEAARLETKAKPPSGV